MNPQWNTPPDGDFARLVERLAAEAALPKPAATAHEHALDVGMAPSSSPQAGVQRAAPSTGAPGSVPVRPSVAFQLRGWIGRALREWVDQQLAKQQKERRSK